jgi:hypothetical protein
MNIFGFQEGYRGKGEGPGRGVGEGRRRCISGNM